MTRYPEISRRVPDKYHNMEHDEVEEIEKLVEGTENVGEYEVDNSILNSQNDPNTRLEPRSYKESLVEEKAVVFSQPMNVIDEEDEVVAQHGTKTQVPIHQGFIMKRQQSQADVVKMIVDTIQQERENLQAEITLQINNAITNHIPSQVDSSVRNYISEIKTILMMMLITRRENIAKRKKTSEHGTYVFGESSSGQVNESEPDLRGDQGLHSSKNSTRSPRDITLNLLLYLIVHKQLLDAFKPHWGYDPGKLRATPDLLTSIAGGLDHVNPIIRLPIKHGISIGTRGGPIPRMIPTVGIKSIIKLSKHSLSWYKEGDSKNNNLNVLFKQINNFEQNINDITEDVRMAQHKYQRPDEGRNSKLEETLSTFIDETRRKQRVSENLFWKIKKNYDKTFKRQASSVTPPKSTTHRNSTWGDTS
uniref:Uncharacterized protein n=1 Tax=Tanacetum cinerariifolium TaxID=118510 RepID=A0A699HRX9_TANCI|nr:hypothetical protein [Tanacetum cinerariifolium]